MRRFLIPILSLFYLLPLTAAPLHNGTIEGLITDAESGAELPGVLVRLLPAGAATTTNTLGHFQFGQLPAGEYTLETQYLGFAVKRLEHITVTDGATTTVRFALESASVDLATVSIEGLDKKEAFQTFSALDIQTRPVNSAQEVLRMVPGLFIAQHAGGGKAEQLFLRGFDIDHGTDLALSVDGMPVNMVSHAHGQGYADLHFVIPELISNIDYKKGPYEASSGDFTTAGSVQLHTVNALDANFLKFEGGQFGTGRLVGGFNLLGQDAARPNRHAFVAAELLRTDGYFEHPQDFQRVNVLAKYNALVQEDTRVGFSASVFQSAWNASGQVPQRAVDAGAITRFGAIDSTEGGQTGRINFSFDVIKNLPNNSLLTNQLYFSDYRFELYSNFTFFLNDPVNGDQIRQKEHRHLLGYNGKWEKQVDALHRTWHTEIGWSVRQDQIMGDELSRTRQRDFQTKALALGNVHQTNTAAYATTRVALTPWLSAQPGIRADFFRFSYENQLDSVYAPQQVQKPVVSPKLQLWSDLSPALRLYWSGGYGFHSNDARVVVAQRGLNILPQARGMDLGFLYKPDKAVLLNIAAWYLFLDQEFVYVGDEAVVEPGGQTRRMGLDGSVRAQFRQNWVADLDVTYAYARALGEPEDAARIPLAPVVTGTGGIHRSPVQGFTAGLRFRYLSDRPANEDNSLIAKGYFLLDASTGWKNDRWELTVSAQNLLNSAWNEAQFATTSRLLDEPAPVTEIHFTPGAPVWVKGSVGVRF